MALTSEQLELCREWTTAPNRKWQTLNRSQWKYQFHEKTLVRYVEEATMDESIVPLLLEYLTAEDGEGGFLCADSLQLYGQPVGSEWTPVRAWYEPSNKAVGNVRSVRLYHALTREPDEAGDGPYVVHDGCAYRVSWTYFWRQSEVMECPPSESGVTYQISGLSRDPETGLFSYALEKRERVRQDIPEYVTEVTAFQEGKEEAHFGVRGDLSVGGQEASSGGGVVVTRRVTKNEDCTHDVHNTTTTELPVGDAVVEYRKTLYGTVETTTDKNQVSPLDDSGLRIGESRQSRKTPGGLYDNTISVVENEAAGEVGASCTKTIFEHQHQTTTNQLAKPTGEVAAAGGGVVNRRVSHETEQGTWNVTESSETELPVANAVVETHRTLRGTRRSVTNRNQAEPLPDASEIGESVGNRKTEGGLYDTTRTTTTITIPGVIASSCEKSAAQHTDVETRVVDANSGDAVLGGHVAVPAQNTVVEKSVRLNEDGSTADVTERTRTVLPQEGGSESASGLADEGTVQTSERTDNATEMAELPGRAVNREVSVSNAPNGMGGFTAVTTTTTHYPFDSGEVSWNDDENVHIVRRYRNQPDIILPGNDAPGSKSVNFQRNGHSSWDGGYGITRPRLEAELGNGEGFGIRIIDRDRDVTYAQTRRRERYSWSWSNDLNVNKWGAYYWVWEMRRVCTMQVRYIGLTSQRADALKSELDALFTRTVRESIFEPNADPGYFKEDMSETVTHRAFMRMADVVKYHITGSAWGVLLKVNEVTTRLRTPDQFFSADVLFQYEEGWSYDIPAGKENIG